MPKYRVTLPEAPGEEFEVDAPEGADFDEIENEIRQQRTREKAQLSAKAALDKAVKPVASPATPIGDLVSNKTAGAVAEGLAGPLTGAVPGLVTLNPPLALAGAIGGALPSIFGSRTTVAEGLMNMVPTPKLPKLPGVLGKLFNYGDRAKPAAEVLDALPTATPYASAFKTRVGNMLKGGAGGATDATARDLATQTLETGEAKRNPSATTAGAVLGGISGAANVTPILATLKQQGKAHTKTIEETAQELAERQLSDKRKIEKIREAARAEVRPNTTNIKAQIPPQEAAVKSLEDQMSLRQKSAKGDKELLLAKEAALDQLTAERAAAGKTRPTKQMQTLKTEIDDLRSKNTLSQTAEDADFTSLKGQRDELRKNREVLKEFTEEPEKFNARVEMLVDDYLANTSSRGGSKKTLADATAELRDRINKGEVDLEKLSGEARKLTKMLDEEGHQTALGSVAGNLAYHAYQMFPTGISRGAAGGLGAAIARGSKEAVEKANAALSRKMSQEKVRAVNKFIQGTINTMNEHITKAEIRESLQDTEEEPSAPGSRQALLEAIAQQEGYYSEKSDARPRRNKNPGMLRGKEGFYMYPTDEEGWTALGDLLEKNKGKTLRQYISQHAPPEDNNDTEAYIRNTIERLKKKGISVSEDTLLEELLAQ